MTALKWITTEAKKIRKKYPKKEWKDCVAQASAIYASKHKGKSPIGKKKKKTVGAVKKVAKKKVAKKKTAKKSGSYHTDKQSHNVKISVMSGIGAIGAAIKHYQGKYGSLAGKKIGVKTKREKTAILKEMRALESKIKKLKSI